MITRIYFIQQLNNFSGSPRVLSSVIHYFNQRNDFQIHLLTSKSKGFLSDLNKNIIYHSNRYKWSANKSILLMSFLLSQLYSFFFILFSVKKNDIVYINTILPFMAAIAARLTKCKIIYHVHEIYLKPNIFQKLAYRIMYLTSDQIISVSEYVKSNLKKASIVVHNSLPSNLILSKQIKEDVEYIKKKYNNRLIIMPASLRKYKGVDLFLTVAKEMNDYCFALIVNETDAVINNYFQSEIIPGNFQIINDQKLLNEKYKDASIVINLTLPNLCIETFGMTLIEGFYFGSPCIAFNYGGPKEIIEHNKNGILIESDSINEIMSSIRLITKDLNQYQTFSKNATLACLKYEAEFISDQIFKIVNNHSK